MHLRSTDQAVATPVPPQDDGDARPARRSPLQRRLLWTGGAIVGLGLLVVTPPLVNANRYRGKIAESMSKSLGRPVHLDNVSLHLLPVPGFTLQNFVVSELPEFGAEPTIRANTVEATLRVSSLWHRPVEFSTVRFVEPSVNLVRNAEGHWNLSDVLLHASHVQSAPTDQRRAGPTPRFPYIEATGGRVNVKLGAEKLPFSLSDTDFALWLPSSQQWRVRLIGSPARTDRNITDPGRLRIEGELRHAGTAATVPVDFRASWHDAPLGEATRILSGEDRGWRGSLNLDASLQGTLGAARLSTKLTLGGLRRTEFFPARPLDLQVTCDSGFALHPAALSNLRCSLPDNAPQPLTLSAETVRFQDLRATSAVVHGQDIPARWALLWAALFSSRVPTDLQPTGTLDVDLTHGQVSGAPNPSPSLKLGVGRKHPTKPVADRGTGPRWAGIVRLTLPPEAAPPASDASAASTVLNWDVVPAANGDHLSSLRLPATPLSLGNGAKVTMTGSLGEPGYSLSVAGTASAAELLLPARYLPQLADGMEKVLPYPPTGAAPGRVQFTCTRTWSTAQTCSGLEPTGKTGALIVPVESGTDVRSARTPSALAPRNLSPLENAPFSTPRPLTTEPTPH